MTGVSGLRWGRSRGRTDPLTGLSTRETLRRHGPPLLAQAGACGRPAALLLLDLDGFKALNDTAGHHVGDRVLSAVGGRLRDVADDHDLVVRLGGDEFAWLTAPLPDAASGAARARAAIDAIGVPVEVDDLRVSVGVSVGLATYGEAGTTLEELLRAADQAMYRAKAAGTGQWRSARAAGPDEGDNEQLLADLSSGRVAEELVLHYQPQVAVPTGAVVGFEALVRWQHPELGLLPPGDFVPLAKRSGLMRPLNEAVLERALGDLPTLQRAAPAARVSVNVSRRHILGEGLVEDLSHRVERHDVSPRHVVLEITEPVTRSTTGTSRTFAALSARGFRVSIRGFGSARSSLTDLWSNPAVGEVKIDAALVGRLASDAETVRLARGLTAAAHALGIRVVAEGVEDPAALAAARELGSDVVQGFQLATPLPLTDVVRWAAVRPRPTSPPAG